MHDRPPRSRRDDTERADEEPFATFGELKAFVRRAKKDFDFGVARKRIIATLKGPAKLEPTHRVWARQQLALCTYKDEELLPKKRFKDALAILETIGMRNPSAAGPEIPPDSLPETLALGGAVYKRMFDWNGQIENLYCALGFYRSAWKTSYRVDGGYGGVNAAYILDLLHSRVRAVSASTGTLLPEVAELEREARALREEMKSEIPKLAVEETDRLKDYWHLVILAEIHFGLREYAEAGLWLAKARAVNGDPWARQTTFRQLVSLARLQGHVPPPERSPMDAWPEPWKALASFFDSDADRAFSCWRGKVGLALSGGGFRASLFHLGVLARMAEMDVLRSVEVLSTVSGGSIVGAHYYLEVRSLLSNKRDEEISREDYIRVVERVSNRFLTAVQTDLRSQTLTNLFCNLKMIAPRLFGAKSYTRSHRIGELYDRRIYSTVDDGNKSGRLRIMRELLIAPCGAPDLPPFKPKFSNWERRARVPVLLLNSTALNSGHTWQFTARSMGEPPGLLGDEMEINPRYRRPYYEDAPDDLKQYPLGHAVAASACVPGLFEPLTIEGLYSDRTVRLVDGGVHDNQGVQALLDESCDFILCSDASGQIEDTSSPPDAMIGVVLRSSSIVQSRVREAEYQDLVARLDSRALKGLFFIHLKKDLTSAPLPWIGCRDAAPEALRPGTTPYGMDREIQRMLASLRTDLDAFSDLEAYSLMLSGYLMTKQQFEALDAEHRRQLQPGSWGGFDIGAPRRAWRFLGLEGIAAEGPDSPDVRRRELGIHLAVGSRLAFKVWFLSPPLRIAAWAFFAAMLILAAFALCRTWDHSIGPWTVAGVVTSGTLLVLGLLWPAFEWIDPRRATQSWLIKFGLATLGWIAANIHVRLFNPIFCKRGSLDRLLEQPPKRRAVR